jgi:phage-related protein
MKQSTNIARVFYFFFVGSKIIATHGFVKKTRKTPKSEIERALRYKGEYERREQARLAEKVK